MRKLIDLTGQTFNGITIIQELGKGEVIGKCVYCGSEKEYYKYAVIRNSYNSCGCMPENLIDRTGQTFGDIKIIKELGKNKVIGKCIHCGSEKEYNRHSVLGGDYHSCGCIKLRFIDRTGQTFSGVEIVKELGGGTVIGRCTYCEYEGTYSKANLVGGIIHCKNCYAGDKYNVHNIDGHTINNVVIIKYEYNGRDKKLYYTCKCNKCGEELLLNYDEIFTYQCNK